MKESLRKDNEAVQDLKAEIVVMNNENKQLKVKTKVCISSLVLSAHFNYHQSLNLSLKMFLFVKDLQANLRKITEELSEFQKRSETFGAELAASTKNVTEHQKV